MHEFVIRNALIWVNGVRVADDRGIIDPFPSSRTKRR